MAQIRLLALSAFFFYILTPSFASTQSLHQQANAKTGFEVTLTHVDAGKNFTRFELLQRATKRSRQRVEKLHAMSLASSDPSLDSPVHAGNGEFLMQLSIGTPPLPYSAILDTGSDLIWAQCKPCKKCFHQPTPLFDPKNSSSFSILPCTSDLCTALPKFACNSGECAYMYTYGDYSYTEGVMGLETFTFGNVSVPKIGFGCGLVNSGGGFDQGGGLVGLGRGPLSLVSQLNEPMFSYCLTSIDSTKRSKLLIGSLADLKAGASSEYTLLTTPLIKNPSSPSFYYLSLKGITIGDTLLPINRSTFAIGEDGSGGMIIDSGTTITYLEQSAFEILKEEFSKQIGLTEDDGDGDSGLDLCFKLPSNAQSIEVPKMIFHFDGTDLDLPGENYFVADESGVGCLAMGSSSGMSIFGNFQQQNLLIVHELVKESVSFVQTRCDRL